MKIKQIHHVAYRCKNAKQTVEWYQKYLDMNFILAIAENEGALSAAYALKLLQSEGELTIASTAKDPQTGQLATRTYRVQGPVMLMLTTTAIDIDEELLNRCLVLTVNESREQTEAIHARQRQQQSEGQRSNRRHSPLCQRALVGAGHDGVNAPVHYMIDCGRSTGTQADAQIAEDQHRPGHAGAGRQEHAHQRRNQHQDQHLGLGQLQIIAPQRPLCLLAHQGRHGCSPLRL